MHRDLICTLCGRSGHNASKCPWRSNDLHTLKATAAFLIGVCWLLGLQFNRPVEGIVLGFVAVGAVIWILGKDEE